MASIRAHLIDALLRRTTKVKLQRCKTPREVRAIFDGVVSRQVKGARYTPAAIGGVDGEWVEAQAVQAVGTLLYLHGGGYVGMSAKSHRAITGHLALGGLRVFAANYRLAPENPYPAALDDARAAWMALAEQSPGGVAVAGDSAGGGLSLALLQSLRDTGHAAAGAVLFSPWTDLSGSGNSIAANRGRDALLVSEGMPVIAAAYLGATDPKTPGASPLFGSFEGLPPLKIFVGDREVLLDDARRAEGRAREAGVKVDLEIWPVVPHVWQLMPAILPEARKSLTSAAAFLRGCFAAQPV